MKNFSFTRRQFIGLAGAVTASLVVPRRLSADETTNVATDASTNAPSALPPAFTVGPFKKIYDPSVGEKEGWYINDHAFIRTEDGTWHLFGITHKEPAAPLDEKVFAHATASNLKGPWTKQPGVLPYDPSAGETHVWAPYVLRNDDQYWMYYCGGGIPTDKSWDGEDHAKYRVQLATSPDLFKWERSPDNPMLVDGFDARDPMVFKVDDQWVLYYCATSNPGGGNHTVEAVTSTDLIHWSSKKEVFRHPETGTSGGPTESPFVVKRNDKYYLFVCTNVGYNETAAYISDSPFHWDITNLVGKFPAHAAEIVVTPDDKWYASRAGWGQGGVYLAELTWKV
jgi:hypothetical protein